MSGLARAHDVERHFCRAAKRRFDGVAPCCLAHRPSLRQPVRSDDILVRGRIFIDELHRVLAQLLQFVAGAVERRTLLSPSRCACAACARPWSGATKATEAVSAAADPPPGVGALLANSASSSAERAVGERCHGGVYCVWR
jgi:hypothetical protein